MLKVGDLVQLHKDEFSVWGIDRSNVGLVCMIHEGSVPRTISVVWAGDPHQHEEYEDGLVLVPKKES